MAGAGVAAARGGIGAGPGAAACRGRGDPCNANHGCCPGARCRNGSCRCRRFTRDCNDTGLCDTDVSSDSDNCGACGAVCPLATPCCHKGKCRPRCGDTCCADCCGDACCADCFVEVPLLGEPDLEDAVCCAAVGGNFCQRRDPGPGDDRCCYEDEACVDERCCCDNCRGARVCGDKCCPIAACCNDACCPKGKVCAQTGGAGTLGCVSANRICSNAGDCFANEICHGGTCCSGNRVCESVGGEQTCCAADEWCEISLAPVGVCVPINTSKSTYRGRRIRP